MATTDGDATPTKAGLKRLPKNAAKRAEARTGWLFISPVIIILGIFLVIPMLMALWVSVSDWGGRGSPFAPGVNFVGFENYTDVLLDEGLAARDFGISIKNSFWYTIIVVPVQTLLALFLAVLVNREVKGRGLFRTAFYFPSVTSSVAITVLWLFLFSATGAVNKALSWLGIHGPNWFNEPTGIFAFLQGGNPPSALANHGFLNLSWSDWLAGPSPAMVAFMIMAVFTTSGTFMLLFLSALQAIDPSTDEAAMVDGANAWKRFWRVTVPQLKPTIYTVVTLGIIGCWQVFDQIYTGTAGGPAKTTLTPAYLSYSAAFGNQQWGRGAAIAFILFVIIIAMNWLQRRALAERDATTGKKSLFSRLRNCKSKAEPAGAEDQVGSQTTAGSQAQVQAVVGVKGNLS
ncbi:sugar ABC transporter permease [uncultured Actinobaculum sp.]|uniref:carbohydrate ABC transporter permease n=1 Tax=uncultured Actinobaculum sp. TaxID=655643 RepID=UPI002805F7C0|nr:sugar ABC transporter permease [uncultured Actinobaculum sp.]